MVFLTLFLEHIFNVIFRHYKLIWTFKLIELSPQPNLVNSFITYFSLDPSISCHVINLYHQQNILMSSNSSKGPITKKWEFFWLHTREWDQTEHLSSAVISLNFTAVFKLISPCWYPYFFTFPWFVLYYSCLRLFLRVNLLYTPIEILWS